MDKINKLVGTVQTRLVQNVSEMTASQNQSSEQNTNNRENDDKKINWFFNELARIFGQKFTIAFPSEKSEQSAKDVYGDLIASFTKEEAIQGRQEIIDQRALGGLQWLDLSEVLPLFDKTQLKPEKIAELYMEYLNGGVDLTRPKRHPDGHIVNEKYGVQWSTGFMREISGRLGAARYHESTHKKGAQKVFEKALRAILLEQKTGAVFELPLQIEDKSQEVRSREHYKEAGKSGHADFMKQFKGKG